MQVHTHTNEHYGESYRRKSKEKLLILKQNSSKDLLTTVGQPHLLPP